ncbi:MAG: tetratricopeptide repeat protein, partial [Pseudomonadota bacterium]
DPSSAIDYANIGSNLREMGHFEEAIGWYESAIEIDPGIQFAHDNIIKLRKAAKECPKSLTLVQGQGRRGF